MQRSKKKLQKMNKNNIPYTVLAEYYDRLISGYPYDKVIDKVSSLVKGKGVDLGTGSGRIAIALSKKGHSVVGVDSSSQMLQKARENAISAGVKPVFVQSDVMKLDFTKVDFVTATCDVVNYLSGYQDLKKLASKVYDALSVDGYFIFDVSSAYKFSLMKDQQFFEDREDVTYLWCNQMRGNKLVMSLAYFIPNGEGHYERYDEEHTMFVYDTQKICDTLTGIGFSVKTYGEKLDKLKK